MRIHELYLKAFGPFDDVKIAFEGEGGEVGLCVVYGQNEVGKSSALRAIRDLLYGIPMRSTDNFRHEHGKMRVGARLSFDDGERFDFIRRKSKKDSMLIYPPVGAAADGIERPISNDRFDAWIRSTPVHVFDHFYGLDHGGLSRGSEALLESNGELGQALFAAGLGSENLRAVLADLEDEAKALFKPAGKNPTINASIDDLKKIKDRIAKESLKPADVKKAQAAERETKGRLESLERELIARQGELSRHERIRLTLPALARYRLKLQHVADFEGTIELVEGFEARLHACRLEAAQARADLDRTARQIESLESKRRELEPSPQLLEARSSIEELGNGIGAYQNALEDLPKRQASMEQVNAQLRSIHQSAGTSDSQGDLEAMNAPLARAPRIKELADGVIKCETRLEAAKNELEKARAARERWAKEVESCHEPPDSGPLGGALARARKLGEIDDRLAIQGPGIEAAEADCEGLLTSLGRWNGSLEGIDRLEIPEAESVNRFVSRFDELRRARLALDNDRERLAVERRETDEQLSRLRGERSVPSEAERDAVRADRDQTWRDIRRRWIDRDPAASADVPRDDTTIPERFEREIAGADRVADRLRDEASRVAQEAQLVARLGRIETEFDEVVRRGVELDRSEQDARRDWGSIWTDLGIDPGDPVEMRGWLERFRSLRENVTAARNERREWNAEKQVRDAAHAGLDDALRALGRTGEGQRLDELVRIGESLESEYDAARARGVRIREEEQQAAESLAVAESAHGKCLDALDAIREELGNAIEGLNLPRLPRPREVHERLDQLMEMRRLMGERDDLAGRIDGMTSDIARYSNAVTELAARCAPSLEALDLAPDRTTARLRELLERATEEESKRASIDASLDELREEQAAADHVLRTVAEAMFELREEAGAADDDALDAALASSNALVEARRGLDDEALNLADLGQGRSPGELEAEAEDLDSDELRARIESLKSEVERLTKETNEAREESGAHAKTLADMDGSEDVAALAEEEQAVLATISADARRYATLALARGILGREIERYRERNETPVLGRAAELFRKLTRGRYVDVHSEYDASDTPQLIAVQADGERKNMKQLSNGTRDQLYLALRLASLEEAIGRGDSMPFIADDILIEFDDERSRVALEVLAELAGKTQILLFSHHAHVAEQARELGGRVHVVDL